MVDVAVRVDLCDADARVFVKASADEPTRRLGGREARRSTFRGRSETGGMWSHEWEDGDADTRGGQPRPSQKSGAQPRTGNDEHADVVRRGLEENVDVGDKARTDAGVGRDGNLQNFQHS